MHVKAVLLIGDYANKENTMDWVLNVGDDENPLNNREILSFSVWARELKVDAWGRFVGISRISGDFPLVLGYVGVFADIYDCNKIILPS
jgi:hypothetical protein